MSPSKPLCYWFAWKMSHRNSPLHLPVTERLWDHEEQPGQSFKIIELFFELCLVTFFLGLWHLERWPRSGPWLARGEERGSWQHAAHQLGHSKCLHQTANGKMAGWGWAFALLLKSQLKPLLSFNLLTPLVFKITFTSFPSGAGLM